MSDFDTFRREVKERADAEIAARMDEYKAGVYRILGMEFVADDSVPPGEVWACGPPRYEVRTDGPRVALTERRTVLGKIGGLKHD